MPGQLTENVWKIIACPQCGRPIEKQMGGSGYCSPCMITYPVTDSGSLDLRLQQEREVKMTFQLNTPLLPRDGFDFSPMIINPNPAVDFSKSAVPSHLSRENMSYFPRAATPQSRVLDIGCGNEVHRSVCEEAGFDYVGMDYENPAASILGDAHALPFLSNSFEFLLSVTVLEHIRYPFMMMQEAYRVLQPGGTFVGTVAFLEPFHGGCYYHHTHLGTYNTLQSGGFKVHIVAPDESWTVLTAQAEMGLFPGMPRSLARLTVAPIEIFHRLWWAIGSRIRGKTDRYERIRSMAGGFSFVATKPG